MNITIIANDNKGTKAYDGARLKLKNIKKALSLLEHNVSIIDVAYWKTNPLKIIHKFKIALVSSDVVIIMCAFNGSRFFLKLLKYFKKTAKVVFCPIGIGCVAAITRHLPPTQEQDFLSCRDFFGLKDSIMEKQLKRVDSVVVENDLLKKLYINFYKLSNVSVLTNFRFIDSPILHKPFNKGLLKIIFLSRLTESKGVLDICKAVSTANSKSPSVVLDIYGPNFLDGKDLEYFNKFITNDSNRISYKGKLDNDEVLNALCNYDLYCFPVKSHEGTPGSLIEAIIAGTPALCSSIPQIQEFVSDGKDGFVFKFGSAISLSRKLEYIIKSKSILPEMSEKLLEKSKKFTFEGNREAIVNAFLLK